MRGLPRMDDAARALLHALREPSRLSGCPPLVLTELLGRARNCALLGRLAARARRAGVMSTLHPRLAEHFRAALIQAEAHQRMAKFEINRLQRALGALGDGMILLKGAAYVAAGLPAAEGRHSGDVDLLLPKSRLPAVEASLMAKGWVQEYQADYTQDYYRLWMHELPPLRHATRLSVVDIHHTILPATNRLQPDAAALIAAAVPVPGLPGVRMLDAPDMILHLAAHLAQDGDFSHSLREVVDLDDLLRHFASRPGFWAELLRRADHHRLGRPLHYAIAMSRALLDTPVPADTILALRHFALPSPLDRLVRAMMAASLAASGRSAVDAPTRFCREALYIRSHWLRMPPLMLARHLGRKSLMRLQAALRPSTP
ncbi:MAG: nucleotidyltransferase family protein [Alphaproteobacteria bacterium]|nr:nucleotidyltransferase family protein [Alphaproteobacteria bacterium]